MQKFPDIAAAAFLLIPAPAVAHRPAILVCLQAVVRAHRALRRFGTWRLLLLSLAIMLPTQGRADVKFVENRRIGDWQFLAAYDEDSSYGSCSSVLLTGSEPTLSLEFTRMSGFQIELNGTQLGWKFPVGAEYAGSYVIDDQPPAVTKLWGFLDSNLSIDLGDDFSRADDLRHGRRIAVHTPKGVFNFSLTGSGRVIDAMQSCAERWLRFRDAAAPTPPPSGSTFLTDEEKKELPEPIGVLSRDMNLYSSPWVGYWTINAMDGMDGDFDHCDSDPTPLRDPRISFDFNRNLIWSIGLSKKGWKLPTDKPLKVAIAIDDGTFATLDAKVIFAEDLTVRLGRNPSMLGKVKAGKKIRFRINGEILEFDLAGADRALSAVQRCVTYYLTLEGSLPAGAPTLDDLRTTSAPESSVLAQARGANQAERAAIPDAQPATRSKQYEVSRVGDWSVSALPGPEDFVVCATGRVPVVGTRLVFEVGQTSAWGMTLINEQWRLNKSNRFNLQYVIDDAVPVQVSGEPVHDTAVLVKLGPGDAAAEPFKRGKTLRIVAAKGTFTFDLTGARAALDAAYECMKRNSGQLEAVKDPFSAEPTQPLPDANASAEPPSESAETAVKAPIAADAVAKEVDVAIEALRGHPMGRVILEHDPSAEPMLRERLQTLAQSTPSDRWVRVVTAVFGEMMREKFFAAIKVAPPEAMAVVVRHNRDVANGLRLEPKTCAAFFRALNSGNLGILPNDLRDAEVEVQSQLMAAAYERPQPTASLLSAQELGSTLGSAFEAQGYSAEDIGALGKFDEVDDHEKCRLANAYFSAVAALDDTKAGNVYRSFMWGSAEALNAATAAGSSSAKFETSMPVAAPSAAADTSSAPVVPEAAPPMDPGLEGSIAAAKKVKIMQVIFAHDPSAEAEFRGRLYRVARASPGDKKAVQAEAQAFLGERLELAMKIAPADVLARMARNDRDVMRQLQDRPEICATFFRTGGRSDFGFLPAPLRGARSDGYAEMIAAAAERPAPTPGLKEEQLGSWLVDAYVKLGLPGEDLDRLDNLGSLQDREVCRLGGELMTAVASLSEDRAGEVYRWMVMSGDEP